MSQSVTTNPFLKNLIRWGLLFPVMLLFINPFFYGNDLIDPGELALVDQWHTDVARLQQRTDQRFDAWFVQPGLYHRSRQLFGADRATESPPLGEMTRISAQWVIGFWKTIYRAYWRGQALWDMLFWAVIWVGAALVVDGMVFRAKRRFQFMGSEAGQLYFALYVGSTALGMLVFLPLAPFSLNGWYVLLWLSGALGALWALAAFR